jgi:hypothetical protein
MIGLTAHEEDLRTALMAERRASLITGAIDLATYFATHSADLPELCSLSYRTQGGDDSERRARVDEIAAMLGVEPRTLPDGTYMASREFGPFKVEAHTTPAAVRQENARRIFHGMGTAA